MPTDLAIRINGESLVLDASGAAFWPAAGTLIFADLHFEKGSSYARGGQFLPPYDTRTTLLRMMAAAARFQPRRILALGDSFHDSGAGERMEGGMRGQLLALAPDFIWIAGNHDPKLPPWLDGLVAASWSEGGLSFRHEPSEERLPGEVAGHLHPCARVARWGRSVRRRCFVGDIARLVLPSFGAYTGGLDVEEEAITRLFDERFHAFMLGTERVYAVARRSSRKAC